MVLYTSTESGIKGECLTEGHAFIVIRLSWKLTGNAVHVDC